MNDKRNQKSKNSFWTTIPGILTGFAAIITAIGGLIAVLYQVDILKPSMTTQTITSHLTTDDSIAGKWTGTVHTQTGNIIQIDLFVETDCIIDRVCGTVASSAGCTGKLVLKDIKSKTFVFLYRDVEGPDRCSNLSGAVVRLELDGNLLWSLRNTSPSGKQIATDGVLRRL